MPSSLEKTANFIDRSKWGGLAIVLTLFLLLTLLHSIIVPITQGEDELAHYRYISFIAETGRLPINAEEREQAWYRADWPPLYHLLVGWSVASLDTTQPVLKDVGESPHRRLVGEIFYPRLLIYTEDALWPWQDGILAWHIGRVISILFAGGALIFTYLTALELFKTFMNERSEARPARPERKRGMPNKAERTRRALSSNFGDISPRLFALSVTALLALIPRFVFTSSMLGDDSLMILLSAATVYLLVRVLRGDDRLWLYGAMGVLLGLSIATKYSTGLLPLVFLPVALWRAKDLGARWTHWLSRIAVGWLASVLGASWWFGWIGYHFNTVQRDGLFFGLLQPLLNAGPDVSMRRIFAFFTGETFTGQERPAAIEAGTFFEWWTYLFQTFWGVPVLERDPLFPFAYLLMLLLCLAALIGLWRLWRTASTQTRVILAALALMVLLLFPFPILRYYLTRNVLETGQGRHILYPAAQTIPLLLMLGWLQFGTLMKERFHVSRITPYAFLLGLPALLLLWTVFQLTYMTLTYPDPLPIRTTTFEADAIAQPEPHAFSDGITLRGYEVALDEAVGLGNVTLFWQAEATLHQNYRTRLRVIDSAGEPRLTWLSHPVNGLYPTRAWDKGDVIRDRLPLPLATLPSGAYTLELAVLPEADDTPLNEAITLTEITLPELSLLETQPLGGLNYRLWTGEEPLRHRQTIPLAWVQGDAPLAAARDGLVSDAPPVWSLVGPDDVPRTPATRSESTAMFIVGAEWPSGDYHLQLERNGETHRTDQAVLTVANDVRFFELPPTIEGYIPVEATFGTPQGEPQVKLLGYTLPQRRTDAGGGLPITIYWQSVAPVLDDYVVFDVLLDREQEAYGGYDRLPREYYSTILWAEGEVVEDGFVVPVRPDAPPGVYQLHVGLYTLKTGEPVSLPLLEEGQPIDSSSVVIGPIKVGGPPAEAVTEAAAPQITLNQPFGEAITLLGYDRDLTADALTLTLYWQSNGPLPVDYTTFLHLRDANGETIRQKDSPPANGLYPTSLWDSGEIIVDQITLPLEDAPSGDYTPVIGLYDRLSGGRLPVGDGPENELPLEGVTLP